MCVCVCARTCINYNLFPFSVQHLCLGHVCVCLCVCVRGVRVCVCVCVCVCMNYHLIAVQPFCLSDARVCVCVCVCVRVGSEREGEVDGD